MLGAIVLALVAVYGLWLRDSSLVRVERVEVTGLGGHEAPEVRADLVAAARRMTTLNVRDRDLERAVAGHPGVRAVEATPRLPHGLEVRVIRHRPVARLSGRGGRGTGPAVAADGTVLRGLLVERPLAALEAGDPTPSGSRGPLTDRGTMRAVRLLAAAPAPFVERVRDVRPRGGDGLVVRLRRGPDLLFGDISRLEAKWSAAVQVLADRASRGAAYVDVRIPDRPAAGGLAAPAGAGAEAAAAGPGTAGTPGAQGSVPGAPALGTGTGTAPGGSQTSPLATPNSQP